MKNTDSIKGITLDQLVMSAYQAKQAIEDLEAQAQVLKDEISDRLKKMKVDGTTTKDGLQVAKISRVLFTDVTLPYARELGATKEAIDSDRLRSLLKKGVKIKGAKTIQFVSIKEEHDHA